MNRLAQGLLRMLFRVQRHKLLERAQHSPDYRIFRVIHDAKGN